MKFKTHIPSNEFTGIMVNTCKEGVITGKYPVTNIEFERFIKDNGYSCPEHWDSEGYCWINNNNIKYPKYWYTKELNNPYYPVTGVSYFEAAAYCSWLSNNDPDYEYYLPTMDQWNDCALPKLENIEYKKIMDLCKRISLESDSHSKFEIFDIQELYLKQKCCDDIIDTIDNEQNTKFILKIIKAIEDKYLLPHYNQLYINRLYCIGQYGPNYMGCYDFFGSVWEWSNEWILQTRPVTDNKYDSIKPEIIALGGPLSKSSPLIWSLIGSWFDPYTRFFKLGFRLAGRKKNFQH